MQSSMQDKLVMPSSSFRKSHSGSRYSGRKSQREHCLLIEPSSQISSSSNNNNCVSFFRGDSRNLNIPQNSGPPLAYPFQLPGQGQMRSARNHSEIKVNTITSTNNDGMDTSQSNLKMIQVQRSNSTLNITPQKKKQSIQICDAECASNKQNNNIITHAGSILPGYPPSKPYQNGAISGKQNISLSYSKYMNTSQNSMLQNSIALENVTNEQSFRKQYPQLVNSNSSSGIKSSQNYQNGKYPIIQQNSTCRGSSSRNNNGSSYPINQNVLLHHNERINKQTTYYMNNNISHSPSPNGKSPNQGILNSSWKVNAIPTQTSRQSSEICPNNSSQKPSLSVYPQKSFLKDSSHRQLYQNQKIFGIQDGSFKKNGGDSSRSLKNNLSQIDYFEGNDPSPMIQHVNIPSTSGNTCSSTSLSSKVNQSEEIKKLKSEIEQFKNREIKYLVRISTLEKDGKKFDEHLEKTEENSRMPKIQGLVQSNNMNNSLIQNTSTNIGGQSLGNSVMNMTQPIDEIQRGARLTQQQFQLEQYFCSHCGSKKQSQQTDENNIASYNKYKTKYSQLRQKHKEVIRQCILDTEKNNEIKMEALIVKQIFLQKFDERMRQSMDHHSFNESPQNTFNHEVNENMPSFLKALTLAQNLRS